MTLLTLLTVLAAQAAPTTYLSAELGVDTTASTLTAVKLGFFDDNAKLIALCEVSGSVSVNNGVVQFNCPFTGWAESTGLLVLSANETAQGWYTAESSSTKLEVSTPDSGAFAGTLVSFDIDGEEPTWFDIDGEEPTWFDPGGTPMWVDIIGGTPVWKDNQGVWKWLDAIQGNPWGLDHATGKPLW